MGVALANTAVVEFDPLRDKSYQATRSGRSVVDYLTWAEIRGTAERTLDTYERALARGCLMFPHVAFEDWGYTELLHVAKSFTTKQRRTRMAAYSAWFKWGIKFRMRPDNPCDLLEIKPHGLPPVKEFTDPEIAVLTGLPDPDGTLMQILFDAGIRKNEATHLQAQHFHVDEPPGQLHVHGKGDKWRVIPCTLKLAQRLAEMILLDGLKPTDHFWYRRGPNGNGLYRDRPIGVGTFHRWWYESLDAAGVKHRNLHTTRHTHATRYIRRGGSLLILSANLGHASVRTTERYTHLGLADRSDEMAFLFDEVAAD